MREDRRIHMRLKEIKPGMVMEHDGEFIAVVEHVCRVKKCE